MELEIYQLLIIVGYFIDARLVLNVHLFSPAVHAVQIQGAFQLKFLTGNRENLEFMTSQYK